MSRILEKIIEYKREEIIQRKQETSIKRLEESPYFDRSTLSLKGQLERRKACGIIAEFKRKSPSVGLINRAADPVDVSTGYVKAGAAALSVLTDKKFFGGIRDDLMKARELNDIPILRKEFIIDPYQVIETRAIGADAILLIASILNNSDLLELAKLARSLGLETILEVHDKSELAGLNKWIDIVGVNNRNLKKMETDVQTSIDLAAMIPEDFMKISESGIHDAETIHFLRGLGYRGFLIGEHFMKHAKPAKACQKLIEKCRSLN